MSTKRRAEENEGDALENLELSDDQMTSLAELTKAQERLELLLDIEATRKMTPLYEKRRPILAKIPKFWLAAFSQHPELLGYIQLKEDREALNHLTDIHVIRDPKEMRAFTVELYFDPNPFFTDSVLRKEYKYIPPPDAASETPDADGITQAMLDFDWDRDVIPQTTTINWKPGQSLTAKYPRKPIEENNDDEDAMDIAVEESAGSFFNLFETAEDPYGIGPSIADELFPSAIDYFFGKVPDGGWEDEDSEEDSEDDDDDAEEIDLERPRKKKGRM
ncbi:hypothetical protein FRC03_012820 [Tulasnella sp. 419]|nr:hypothetical protein FRC02_004531 [Tulasnella sp. 418]KAG8965888.1 hypothetical protein FRC03_012820 [Tulasnella sp. 419]